MRKNNNIPSPFSVQHLTDTMPRDAMLLKIAADLIKLHNRVIERIDHLEADTAKRTGPTGPKPSKVELLQLILEVLPQAELRVYNAHIEAIAKEIQSRIKVPKDGEDAKITPDLIASIVDQVVAKIKVPSPEQIDYTKIEAKLTELLNKRKLTNKDIDGLEQTLSAFNSQLGKGYLHGGGIPSLTAGSNITLTRKSDGGFTVSSSGGSGFTELPATGTVNGNNTAFTFTVKPSYIVTDGVFIKENKGWTWNSGTLTATLTIPPTDDIYGIQ